MDKRFKDKFGNAISFPDKRWNHIIKEHPEIEPYRERISEVLRNPDLIKKSKRDKDTFLYYRYYKNIFNGKYLLVVARLRDNLLLTYYITDRVKQGAIVWKKD